MHIYSPDDESRFGFEKFMTKITSTVDYPQKNLETTHHRNLKTVIHLLSICRSSLGRLNVHTIAYCILRSIKYLLFCHSFINLTAFFLRQRCKTLFLIIWPFLFISVWKKLCKTIFSIVRDASSDIYYC